MARKMPPVHCRVCKKEIDRQNETGWIMPVNKFYYHEACYKDWVEKKDDLHAKATDNEWYEAMLYYLSHVIKAEIDYKKTTSQWKTFLKQNKTAKGIYFAIKYFYTSVCACANFWVVCYKNDCCSCGVYLPEHIKHLFSCFAV